MKRKIFYILLFAAYLLAFAGTSFFWLGRFATSSEEETITIDFSAKWAGPPYPHVIKYWHYPDGLSTVEERVVFYHAGEVPVYSNDIRRSFGDKITIVDFQKPANWSGYLSNVYLVFRSEGEKIVHVTNLNFQDQMNVWGQNFYFYWRRWSGAGEGGKIGVRVDIAYAVTGSSYEEVLASPDQFCEEIVNLGFFDKWTLTFKTYETIKSNFEYQILGACLLSIGLIITIVFIRLDRKIT